MPISLTNIDSFYDVLAVFIVVMAPVIAAGIPLVYKQRQHNQQTAKQLAAVRDQVVNSYPQTGPNLRDDVDAIKAEQARAAERGELIMAVLSSIRDEQVETRRDIGGLRGDIGLVRGEAREDRRNLADLEGRINTFAKREHPGVPPP